LRYGVHKVFRTHRLTHSLTDGQTQLQNVSMKGTKTHPNNTVYNISSPTTDTLESFHFYRLFNVKTEHSCINTSYYHSQMWHGNAIVHICLSVCLCVCLSCSCSNFECLYLETSLSVCKYVFRTFMSRSGIKVTGSRVKVTGT